MESVCHGAGGRTAMIAHGPVGAATVILERLRREGVASIRKRFMAHALGRPRSTGHHGCPKPVAH
jgi:hypothetical protein